MDRFSEVGIRVGDRFVEVEYRAVAVKDRAQQLITAAEHRIQAVYRAIRLHCNRFQCHGGQAAVTDQRRRRLYRAFTHRRPAAGLHSCGAHGVVQRLPGAIQPADQGATRHPCLTGDRDKRNVRHVSAEILGGTQCGRHHVGGHLVNR